MNVLWRVILISFRKDAPEAVKADIYLRYQTIADECGGRDAGILFWKVENNLDLRKNVHLVEIAQFRDNDALQTFRTHPKHKELTDVLSQVAYWQVGDFYGQIP